MKAKVAIIILVLVCVGLGVGLVYLKNHAEEEKTHDVVSILELSNKLVSTESHLAEQRTVNSTLETNLVTGRAELQQLSNNLSSTAATLTQSQKAAKDAADLAAAEMAKRDARITELEGEKDDLTKKMGDLSTAITNLESQITVTQKKLAASEGDREFLVKELKRMQAEKAELEKQFNDLATLKEQIKKLKDELSIARRMEWIREGIYGTRFQKGGERMMQEARPATLKTNQVLDVELHPHTAPVVQTNGVTPLPVPAK